MVGVKQKASAPSRAQPSTDCQRIAFHFQDLGSRAVVADFSGGYLSSDGGVLLLRQVDRALGLSRALATCFVDRRDTRFVEHGDLLRRHVLTLDKPMPNSAFCQKSRRDVFTSLRGLAEHFSRRR